MRRSFAKALHQQMTLNQDIYLITCDLGYGMWDQIQKDYSKRFYNVGASEQAGMDIAVGLALAGKIPFIYSITPFLIYRAFETIRTYINHECIPVKLVGSGRDRDYSHDGISHFAHDVPKFMSNFINIESLYPETKEEIPDLVKKMVTDNDGPYFISLKR